MINKQTLFKLGVILSLVLLLCAKGLYLQAQELDVIIDIPAAGDNRFSICGGERLIDIRVENFSPVDLSGIQMSIDLSSSEGIEYTGTLTVQEGGTVTYDNNSPASAPVFTLPDLPADAVSRFTIGMEALCEAIALSGGGASPNFTLNFTYTGGSGGDAITSTNFEVVKPALTINLIEGNEVPPPLTKTGTSASIFDGLIGATDTVSVRTVNGGNGSLSEFTYWVIDHPLLTLEKVQVGNYELPFLQQSGDTLFYLVDAAAIAQAIPDVTSPPNNTSLLQFNESIHFKEIWTTDACDTDFPDLERGVAYGCAGGTADICESDSRTNGLRFGFLRPVITAATAWSELTVEERLEGLPACYNQDIIRQRVLLINTGSAPAHNVKFSLSAFHPNRTSKVLLPNNTMVSIGKQGTQTNITPVQTYSENQNEGACNLGSQVISADYELEDIGLTIPAGDTLWIEYEMDYLECGCANGTSVCTMERWYFGVLNWADRGRAAQASYTDPCELTTYNINQVNTVDWYSQLGTVQEMPASIIDNQTQVSSFTVNNGRNDWLRDYLNSGRTRYENGIYRMYFTIGNGLDWQGTDGDLSTSDLVWTLQNGETWQPSTIEYTDTQGGDDVLYAEFSFADFPGGYNNRFGNGMKLNMNVVGDCDETGPACSQGSVAQVSSEFYFSPDSNCTDCGDGNLVDCFKSTTTELDCPSCTPCEGIRPISLDVERVNYELPDNDNNYFPDASGVIDMSKVATNRAISGDTVKIIYQATFSTGLTQADFPGAFSLMQLPAGENLSFLPQGGNVTIKKVSGDVYTANILQQFPDGNQIVTNLSPSNLNSLGNAVPELLVYEQDDTVEIEVFLLVEDPDFLSQNEGNNFRDITINDISFASPQTSWPVDQPDRYACDDLEERFYYIEQIHRTDWWHSDNRGGCEKIRVGEYQRWAIGGFGLDYFPFEFRRPKGYLEQTVLTKNPNLEYDRVHWRIASKANNRTINPVGLVALQGGAVYGTLENPTAPGSLVAEGEIPLSSPYVSVIGDEITIYTGAFFRDNFGELEGDEGFISAFSASLKASCASLPVAYNASGEGQVFPDNTWTLDPKVFGYDALEGGRIATPLGEPENNGTNLAYGYLGGPSLQLQVPVTNNQLTGEVACFQAEVLNFTDYDADFSFFSVENLSGGVLVESVVDITDANNPIEIMGNIGGIYPLGSLPGGGSQPTSVLLEVCVRSNNCERDSLFFNVGWDCEGYPASPQESTCARPDTVYVIPTEAELGMVIRNPESPTTADLCETSDFIIELSSAKAGHLNDIELLFALPNGQEILPGTFEIAWPVTSADPNLATYDNPGIDPTNLYGNVHQINISSLNETLNTTGLPGTLEPGQNILFVRFQTTTTCGYASGGRARFLSRAKNNCGERTNQRYSPASPLTITGTTEVLKTQLEVSDSELNPCLGDDMTVDVSFRLRQDSPTTTNNDSIMVVLPPGLTYEPNSLSVIENGVNVEPVIEMNGNEQTIYWPIQTGLIGGEQVTFSFVANSSDVGQGCFPYQLVASTFSSQSAICVNPPPGETCDIRVISDTKEATVVFVKPDLFITNFDGDLTFLPPSQEELNYSLTIFNSGASIPNGSTTTVQIVADLDNDGNFSAGDQILNTVSTTASIPTNTEHTFGGTVPVDAGLTCNLIAVINPEATCACDVRSSFRLSPSLQMVFDKTPTVCSNTPTSIGPDPVAAYAYQWVALNGANIAAISPTDASPTTFQQQNLTGSELMVSYALRVERNATCYAYDTMTVTVYPEEISSAAFDVCQNQSFSLPGPDTGSNFIWTPDADLDDPNIASPTVSGLSAPETFTLNYTDANGCNALKTIDANVISCANTGLGDTVWWDLNYDGIQDIGEPGVEGVTVWLVNPASPNSPIQTTMTDANGAFFFSPLPAGDYQIRFIPTDEMTFTLPNVGSDDANDSDADILTGYTPDRFVFNGLLDSTFDAGIIYVDYGDLPDGTNSTGYLDYQTTSENGAPSHVIIPNLLFGSSVDGEQNGQPTTQANGDDSADGRDDEDGIGISDNQTWVLGSTVNLSIAVTNTTGQTGYVKGYVDWNGNGDFSEAGELVTDINGNSFLTFSNINVPYDLPANQIVGVRYRLSLDPTMTETGQVNSGEIEDYLVQLVCPPIDAPVSGGDLTACSNEPLPTLSVTPPAGMLVDWYTNPTGGTPFLTSSNTLTPADYGTFYAQTREPLNGCVSTSRTAVTVSELPVPTIGSFSFSSDVTCVDDPTVTANVSPTGGTFTWSTGTGANIISATDQQSITVDAPGEYYLTYTAPNGCMIQDTATVVENLEEPGAEAGLESEVNCGTPTITLNGSATVAGSTYAWTTTDGIIDSGANTANPVVSSGGTYTLTTTHPVTGCTSTDDVLVNQPPELSATISQLPQLDCDTPDGSIDVSIVQGTAPYTFAWSNSENTEDLNNLGAGTYTVTIDDAKGCQVILTETISDDSPKFTLIPAAACQSSSSNYDLSVQIDYLFSQGSSATLTLTTGEVQNVTIPMGDGTVTVDFIGLSNTGTTNIGIDFVYDNDTGCNQSSTYDAPAICCQINDPIITLSCEDNLTPNRPEDDLWYYTINPQGIGTGGSVNITGEQFHNNLNLNEVHGPFGPFRIADGGFTVTITDSSNPGCQLVDFIISPPPTCSDFEVDYGDLPNQYNTLETDDGPRHVMIPGLQLGTIVESENDGNPNPLAGVPSNDNGFGINDGVDFVPNATLNIPLTVTNTTGTTSYVDAWIDWNGDGDFDDPNEYIADLTDGTGPYPPFITVTVPDDVAQDVPLGVRMRLSHDDNLQPTGLSYSGEIEDYLIRVTCKRICPGVELRLRE